jgi:hypothetical protein
MNCGARRDPMSQAPAQRGCPPRCTGPSKARAHQADHQSRGSEPGVGIVIHALRILDESSCLAGGRPVVGDMPGAGITAKEIHSTSRHGYVASRAPS